MIRVPSSLAWQVIVCWFALPLGSVFAADITIAYHSPSLQPLSLRLSSELGSQGHQISIEGLPREPGCGSYSASHASAETRLKRVRIHLGRVPGSRDAACAAISYSTPSGTREVHVTASINDMERFSIQVAEALNGLSTRALANDSDATVAPPKIIPPAPIEEPPVSLGMSSTLLLDARHPSPLLGVGILTELPLALSWKLQLDTTWTLTALPFEEQTTELKARILWTRLGVALQVVPPPAELSLFAGAGAAFTWATARVRAPDVARADVASSAIFSAGGVFTYPIHAPLYGYSALRASTLVPAIQFELPSGVTSPFGNLLGEVAIGLRASW